MNGNDALSAILWPQWPYRQQLIGCTTATTNTAKLTMHHPSPQLHLFGATNTAVHHNQSPTRSMRERKYLWHNSW
jgi:hypothetical protein